MGARSDEEKLRLPWTGEFSPGQLGNDALEECLDIIALHEGQREALIEAIRSRWFIDAASARADPAERLLQQRKRAGNVLIGMQQYGLIDSSHNFTPLGRELAAERNSDKRTNRFIGHLLKDARGLELLDAVRDLQQRRVPITNDTLRAELRRRGYAITTNSGDAGKLRQWLGTAGVVSDAWVINDERVAAITGVPLSVIGEWQGLTRAQRAFLATVRRLSETRGTRSIPSPELIDFVLQEHGPVFDEGQVRRIYKVLSDSAWITHTVKSQDGRGGKGGFIAATPKLVDVDFELLLGFRAGDLPADLRAAMTRPLEDIYSQLESSDTYTKGIALELLAVNLATDLGLSPLSLRVRGVRTGGAEVDLIAEAAHLQFSRWLFQCKNTRSVDVGVLAKEVGMATLLQGHVIVIATTGTISKTVRTYARRVAETTPFQVVLVDGAVLSAYRTGGAAILRERFHADAADTLRLKRPQALEVLQDLADDEA